MLVDKQRSFSDYESTTAKMQIKLEKFLAEMEAAMPWQALIGIPSMRRFAGIKLIKERVKDKKRS